MTTDGSSQIDGRKNSYSFQLEKFKSYFFPLPQIFFFCPRPPYNIDLVFKVSAGLRGGLILLDAENMTFISLLFSPKLGDSTVAKSKVLVIITTQVNLDQFLMSPVQAALSLWERVTRIQEGVYDSVISPHLNIFDIQSEPFEIFKVDVNDLALERSCGFQWQVRGVVES